MMLDGGRFLFFLTCPTMAHEYCSSFDVIMRAGQLTFVTVIKLFSVRWGFCSLLYTDKISCLFPLDFGEVSSVCCEMVVGG